jgi:fibronectin type 3 domain-containing protein
MKQFINRRCLALAFLCFAAPMLLLAVPAVAGIPDTPSNIAASNGLYADKVGISWDAVPGAIQYVILRSEKPVSQGGEMTRLAVLTRTFYEDTPPECGITYYYWVRAINADGAGQFGHDKGYCGASVTAGIPDTPSNVAATDGLYADKVSISWDAVSGANQYVILRSEKPISQGGTKTRLAALSRTFYEDTPPERGITYYYWVRAINAAGAGKFGYDKGHCGTPGAEPITGTLQAPENVSATDGDFTDKIMISWNRSPGAASYEIYRAEDFAAPKTRLGATAGTTFEDTTADCCIDYYYWVKARNGGNQSDFFFSDIGYRDCPISAPGNVNASDGKYDDAVLLTWQAARNATSYDIFRSTSPTGGKTRIASTTETTYTDSRVSCNDVYFYWVQAHNFCSASPFSNSDSGYLECLVLENKGSVTAPEEFFPLLSTPTGVSASDGAYTDRIQVTWKSVPDATSYHIYRSDRFAGVKTKISSTRETSYSDRNIPVSTVFYYWIKAKNAAGESDFSKFDSGYRLCPPAPARISASTVNLDRITISWSASKGAVEYDVYYAIFSTASPGMRGKLATVKGTSYSQMQDPCIEVICPDCPPPSANPLYYWVRARSADCTSPFSSVSNGGHILCSPAPTPPPTGVSASKGNFDSHIQVKWNSFLPDQFFKEYQFEVWRATAFDGSKTKVATTSQPAFNDPNVTCSNMYYYWVKRIDSRRIISEFSDYDAGFINCD